MDTHHLLNYLGSLFLLPPKFAFAISQVVIDRKYAHKEKLLDPPNRSTSAWFLLSGIVSASIFDRQGKEIVIRLYKYPIIFTDFGSFLNQKPSTIRLRAVGDIQLQEISLKNFKELIVPFPERHIIKEHMLMQDQLLDQQRSMLVNLSENERFADFASAFPMNNIPNIVGASFLNMGTTKYCNLKAAWNLGIR